STPPAPEKDTPAESRAASPAPETARASCSPSEVLENPTHDRLRRAPAQPLIRHLALVEILARQRTHLIAVAQFQIRPVIKHLAGLVHQPDLHLDRNLRSRRAARIRIDRGRIRKHF